ncbi:hypothetical protein JB92DRAFT_2881526 [Gautieria morchelliformis]|nr:hypothetical protein JB92DRAFT_2881526 [Gautieria morchelliformis]
MSTSAWNIFSGPPTNEDLRRARHLQLLSYMRTGLDKAKVWLGESPNYVSKLAVYTYAMCAQKWVSSAEGRRVCRTIIAVNAAIWLAWQIPRLRPMMTRHFLHYPLSGLSHTLLTSVFSHKNLLHLVCNSLALSGFGSTALLYFSLEQERDPNKLPESTGRYHLLSFFVSAGLFSSFLSHAVRVRFYYPRILSQLSSAGSVTTATTTGAAHTATTAATITPSLGASGAIWACVSLTALAFPDAQMALFIPTSFSIPIQTGTFGMVALDVIGIIRGWRFFDHWAHLGGAMFGVFYYIYGPRIWEEARRHTRPPHWQVPRT